MPVGEIFANDESCHDKVAHYHTSKQRDGERIRRAKMIMQLTTGS